MAWNNTTRKEDKPYSFEKENLVLIEYQKDGRLYLVDNLNNLCIAEDDYLAVSYIPTAPNDTRLPIVAVRSLGATSKHFMEICNWMGFNPNTTDVDIKPRYHEENVIKNISRDGENGEFGDMGGMIVISINPANGEKVTVSSSNPYNEIPNPSNQSSSKPNNSENNGNENNNNENNSSGNSTNQSEESNYDDFLEQLMEDTSKEDKPFELGGSKPGTIFSFVKKVH